MLKAGANAAEIGMAASVTYAGSPLHLYLEGDSFEKQVSLLSASAPDTQAREDAILIGAQPSSPLSIQDVPARPRRLEIGPVTASTPLGTMQHLIQPLPTELSFLVSAPLTEGSQGPDPFAEKLKQLVCSSLLLAGPGAASLHHSPPPRIIQRRHISLTGIRSALFFAAITAVRTKPLWSIISILAMIGTYYTAKTKAKGESSLTALQKRLLAQVEDLLHFAQCFDTSVQRAMGLLRDVECAARRWKLCSPLPHIGRAEQETLPAAEEAMEGLLATGGRLPHEVFPPLRALDVRRVLQRSLRDVRQMCKATGGILERFLRGGLDGEEISGLYAAYGVTSESVHLATLALSNRHTRPLFSPKSDRQQRDSVRSSLTAGGEQRWSMASDTPDLHNPFSSDVVHLSSTCMAHEPPLEDRICMQPRSAHSVTTAAKVCLDTAVERYGYEKGSSREEFTLLSIESSIELLHAARQRVLCHLVALDHDVDPSSLAIALQTATDATAELADRFWCGNEAINAAVEKYFDPNCLPFRSETTKDGELPGSLPAEQSARSDDAYNVLSSIVEHTTSPASPLVYSLKLGSPDRTDQYHANAYMGRSQAMTIALRAVNAKLQIAGADLQSCLSAAESELSEDAERIVELHDSIRQDLQIVLREWSQARVSLRQALTGPLSLFSGQSAAAHVSPKLADEEEWIAVAGESGIDQQSSVVSSELMTPQTCFSPEFDISDMAEADQLDAVGEFFEAYGAPHENPELSREARLQEKREHREWSTSASVRPDRDLVVELKDVLREIAQRRN